MRKVFLEKLPHGGYKIRKDSVNWGKAIGYKVPFIYDNIQGTLEILDYDNLENKITTKYENIIHKIATCAFKNGSFGSCIGEQKIRDLDYIYKIGDIILKGESQLKIIEQKKHESNKKAYSYECLKCGYKKTIILENELTQGTGCPVCNHCIVLKGKNDIATTHPFVFLYLKNKEDAYKYSEGSNKKIEVICPYCKNIRKMTINKLCSRGFSCVKCGDKTPYSEKIMSGLLTQLNIVYETQKIFDWSKNTDKGKKIYDFYFEVKGEKYIIETHGIQHYKNSFSTCGGRTLQEEQENDDYKKQLAISNGIKEENYIIIDCRESEFDFIKENILHSKLNKIFNLSVINWGEVLKNTFTSKIKVASDLWNEGKKIIEISEIMGVGRSTISNWLEKGKQLKLCSYNKKVDNKIKNDRIYL